MHKWIPDIKKRITRLQSTTPKKLDNKDDPKRDMHGCPWKGRGENIRKCVDLVGKETKRDRKENDVLIEEVIMGLGINLVLQNFLGIHKDDSKQ